MKMIETLLRRFGDWLERRLERSERKMLNEAYELAGGGVSGYHAPDPLPALERHLQIMDAGADRTALRLAIREIKRGRGEPAGARIMGFGAPVAPVAPEMLHFIPSSKVPAPATALWCGFEGTWRVSKCRECHLAPQCEHHGRPPT